MASEDDIADDLVNNLITLVIKFCKVFINFVCNVDDVVVLKSCNGVKKSYHLIFKTAIFENNKHCKIFIETFLSRLTNEELGSISFTTTNNSRKSIIDVNVYSTNQNFRLLYSSKFGKNIPLVPVKDGYLIDSCDLFYDSLVSDKSYIVNIHLPLVNNSTETPAVPRVSSVESKMQSDYPHIDRFVSSLLGNGYVRNVRTFENKGTTFKPMVMYNIQGVRYCDNVKREHRRNSIYYIADVSKQVVYQKCYKCVGFRGKDISLA